MRWGAQTWKQRGSAGPRASDYAAISQINMRRARGVPFNAEELRLRIAALGDIELDDGPRHGAFEEIYERFTPPGYSLMPLPDACRIRQSDNRVELSGVLVDDKRHRQVVGRIKRDIHLDKGFVSHDLLTIQRAYRGSQMSLVLLDQTFPLYRDLGLNTVIVHAALTTGRFFWARIGFEPATPQERALLEGVIGLSLFALGQPLLGTGYPLSRAALLGTATSATTTMKELREKLDHLLQHVLLGDPNVQAVRAECDRRTGLESNGQWTWLEEARFKELTAGNGLGYDEELPLGKAIFLGGPDWNGVFDLNNPRAQAVFEAEYRRRRVVLTP